MTNPEEINHRNGTAAASDHELPLPRERSVTNKGWIKLHRSLIDHPRFSDPDWVSVWIFILLNATHTSLRADFDGKIVELQPGQLITGRKALSKATGVSESKVYRVLEMMKSEQQIEQQAGAKGSIITVLNWGSYQVSEQQNGQPLNSNRTATEQLLNTNNKGNKGENGKMKDPTGAVFASLSFPELPEALRTSEAIAAWKKWLAYRAKMRKPVSVDAAQEQFACWKWGPAEFIQSVRDSIKADCKLGLLEPKASKPTWQQLKVIEEAIEKHAANQDSVYYKWAGPSQQEKDDLAQLRKQRKEWHADLLNLNRSNQNPNEPKKGPNHE